MNGIRMRVEKYVEAKEITSENEGEDEAEPSRGRNECMRHLIDGTV